MTENKGVPQIIVNDKVIADVFACSTSYARRLVNDFGMPRVAIGKYDLVECAKWRIKNFQSQIDELKTGSKTEKELKLKILEAEAERKILENMKTKNELVPVVDVREVVDKIFNSIKTKINGWSKLLPKLVIGKNLNQIKSIIEIETDKIISELRTLDV